ncbi:MAG: hypothetical protein AAF497_18460, partial [Planctomycetota bacterium]
DYRLRLKERNHSIRISVTEGDAQHGFAIGGRRILELKGTKPLQIESLKSDDDTIRIKLANANRLTRLHVFATRYDHGHDHYQPFLSLPPLRPLASNWIPQTSLYASGRDLGDELRYIIDRQYAARFPGNMLNRPGLLLNPWELRDTETEIQTAALGEDFQAEREPVPPAAMAAAPESASRLSRKAKSKQQLATSWAATIDFLGQGTKILLNLRPDKDGNVVIKRSELGKHQHLNFIAVDPATTVYRQMSLKATDLPVRDLRLLANLDPTKHFSRSSRTSILKQGDSFQVADTTSAQLSTFESLEDVFNFFVNEHWSKFRFVTKWPELSDEEKREKYSEFACHELHFFLYKKDREFFNEIVRPYISHKMHKTFMDDWLLENDLREYLSPWKFQQLNLAERILLGQRIKSERDSISRHIHDLYSIKPVDITRSTAAFKQGLATRGLNALTRSAVPRLAATLDDDTKNLNWGVNASDDDPAGESADSLLREFSDTAIDFTESGIDLDSDGLAFYSDSGIVGGVAKWVEGGGRRLYRKLKSTSEWAENNYYRLPIASQGGSLVQVGSFWDQYAKHDPDQPFFSSKFTEARENFTVSMLALSVLDLPFKAAEHERETDEARL